MQLHARKIVAIAALMLCSVAVTWASISQLPYWLDLASADQRSALEPMTEMMSAPTPPTPNREEILPSKDATPQAPSQIVVATALPVVAKIEPEPVAVTTTSLAVVNSSAASTAAEKLSTTDTSAQRLASRSEAPSRKKTIGMRGKASPAKSAIVEDLPVSISIETDNNKRSEEGSIAEPRGEYAVEVAHAPSSQSDVPAAQPAAPVVSAPIETPAEKKKLPPVISYF